MAITRAQQARQMLKDGNFVMQGGVRNYLGKQKTVSNAPLKWQSGPDKPATELAYITKAEKDLLLKKDIHGSLKDGPNEGPAGIISLDSFGDKDDKGKDVGMGGGDVSRAERGDFSGFSGDDKERARDIRAGAVAAGAGARDSDDKDIQKRAEQIKKESKKRKREAAAAITKEEKKAARENRKKIRQRLRADKLRRQSKLEAILGGKKTYNTFKYDPKTGKFVTDETIDLPGQGELQEDGTITGANPFGINEKEYQDLISSLPSYKGPPETPEQQQKRINDYLTKNIASTDLSNPLTQLMETNDRFSGVNLEAFQNEFNLPKTGLASLDIALGFAEPFLRKGSKKTKEFFSGTEKGLGKNIFGKGRKSVLEAGRYTYNGLPIDPTTFAMLDPALMDDVYRDYMTRRREGEIDAYGNPLPPRSDDGPGPILPLLPQQPVQDPTTMLPQVSPLFYRFMADGGMTNDAPMMQGGITDLALRDEFFLGGIVKGIKKGLKGVSRAVKKIAKSPVGKAALFAGVAGIPFGGGSFFGSGSLFGKASGLLKSQGLKDFFLKDAAKGLSGGLSTKGILTALTAAPFIGELLGLNKQEEEPIYAGPNLDFNAQQFYRLAADGGLMRQEYDAAGAVMSKEDMEKMSKSPLYKGFKTMYGVDPSMAKENEAYKDKFKQFEQLFKKGYQEGGDVEPVAKKTMPLIDMGGKEKDYRETGGFVDMGRMERADDVPARLSKNEFVFTAEAVRNAGDGDVDKGSEVMYNMMKNLESGGDVSEESQGLGGAREMFQTSKRLEEVI